MSSVRRSGAVLVALLGAAALYPPLSAQTSLPIGLEISVRTRSTTSGAETVVAEGDALRSGDGVQVEIRPARDAYVYVLALGSSGRLEILQPFSRENEQAFQPGERVRVIPGDGRYLPLDDTPGAEALFALAVPAPIGDISSWLEALGRVGSREAIAARLAKDFPGFQSIGFRHMPGTVPVATLPPVDPLPAAAPPAGARGGLFSGRQRSTEPGVLEGTGSKIDALLGGSEPLPVPPPVPDASGSAPLPATGTATGISTSREPSGEPPGGGVLAGLWSRVRNTFAGEKRDDAEEGAAPSDPLAPPSVAPPPAAGVPAAEPSPSAERGPLIPLAASTPLSDPDGRSAPAVMEAASSEPSKALLAIDPDRDPIAEMLVSVITPAGIGGGVVVEPHGTVLTSWNLVESHAEAIVEFRFDPGHSDGSGPARRLARVVGMNANADIALLAVEPPFERAPAIGVADSAAAPGAGSQVHVLSPDRGGWRHDFAIVVQSKPDHSWFSGGNLVHRAAALRLQMSSPPSEDGAAVLNARRQLVGLKVHSGREGQVTAVSVGSIAPLLAAAGIPASLR